MTKGYTILICFLLMYVIVALITMVYVASQSQDLLLCIDTVVRRGGSCEENLFRLIIWSFMWPVVAVVSIGTIILYPPYYVLEMYKSNLVYGATWLIEMLLIK